MSPGRFPALIALALLLGLSPDRAAAQGTPLFPLGSSVAESSHVIKTARGALAGFHVDTAGAAVWVMLVDGTVAPGDGALTGCVDATTTRPCIVSRWQVPATLSAGILLPYPAPFQTGGVLVCSSTGPFTKTATATCTFSLIQVQ